MRPKRRARRPPRRQQSTKPNGHPTRAEPSYGVILTDQEAVDRRHRGLDIVVRGPDKVANRKKAREIEELVGKPVVFDLPHRGRAGPQALPHWHQQSRNPDGHSFYEVDHTKARKKP